LEVLRTIRIDASIKPRGDGITFITYSRSVQLLGVQGFLESDSPSTQADTWFPEKIVEIYQGLFR
jgi:hypothetical protein